MPALSRAKLDQVLLVSLALIGPAEAHGLATPETNDGAWRLAVGLPLLLAALAYRRGLRRAWRRAGPGRAIRWPEAAAAGAGFLSLALLLALPLHAWGRLRFAPHMLEHQILTVLAAPLLAAGRPGLAYLLALPLRWRRRLGFWLMRGPGRALRPPALAPGAAWLLHVAILWLWHTPLLFEAALWSEPVHYLQHVTLLLSACLFWTTILPRRPTQAKQAIALVSLFTTALQATLLGALLTLSPTLWYPTYAGPDALVDQQLAGLIMWVPGGLAYVIAALAIGAQLLRDDPPRRRAPSL